MGKKLTRIEEFYISENPDNLSTEELSKATGVTGQTVRNIQRKYNKRTKKNAKDSVNQEPVSDTPSENSTKFSPFESAVGRHERNGKKVATVMTPAAAQIADNGRKQNLSLRESLKHAIGPTRLKK